MMAQLFSGDNDIQHASAAAEPHLPPGLGRSGDAGVVGRGGGGGEEGRGQ